MRNPLLNPRRQTLGTTYLRQNAGAVREPALHEECEGGVVAHVDVCARRPIVERVPVSVIQLVQDLQGLFVFGEDQVIPHNLDVREVAWERKR